MYNNVSYRNERKDIVKLYTLAHSTVLSLRVYCNNKQGCLYTYHASIHTHAHVCMCVYVVDIFLGMLLLESCHSY